MSERLRIVLLDTKPRNPNHYIALSIAAALRRHPAVDDVIEAHYGNALALAAERSANFFLAYDGENLNTEICRRLRERCGFGALWITDDPYELRHNLDSADLFDVVFTNDEAAAATYGRKGRFLSLGADPETHFAQVRAEGDPGLRYDVFFAGVAWPNRARLLRSLLRDLPDVTFKIALVGNEHIPPFALPLLRSAYDYRIAPRDFARLANASRITLGLHRDFTASAGGRAHTASPPPRIFEAALAGSLQLVSEEMSGIAAAFAPGREIATFRDYHACLDGIRALLANPSARVAAATAAQERALRDHTYDRRVATLLDACAALRAPRRTAAVAPAPARRPRVLQVAHNVVGRAPHGGVEVYLDRLRRWLSRDFEVLTYSLASETGENEFVLLGARGEPLERIAFDGAWQRFSLSNAAKEAQFAELLVRHEISLVHYHHLIGHPLSLPFISRALGIPSVWTLHDHYGICDSFDLLDYEQRFCHIDERSERVCDYCTERRVGLAGAAQRARRAFVGRTLATVDRICLSSESTRALYARFFPDVFDAARTRMLPVPMPEHAAWDAAHPSSGRFTDGAAVPLDIVVLGNFSVEKGALVVLEAARALAADNVRFRVHGRVDREIAARAQALALPNLVLAGEYNPIELAAILEGADCTLHPSIWPETYCIALSEAWAYRRVPIVSRIGALAERVRDGHNGLCVAPGDPGDLVRRIREVLGAPEALATIAAGIEPELWPDAREHTRSLSALYRDVLETHPVTVTLAAGPRRTALSLFDCGIALGDPAPRLPGERPDAQTLLSAGVQKAASEASSGPAFERIGAIARSPADSELHVHLDELDDHGPDLDRAHVGKADDETLWLRGWRIERSLRTPPGNARVLLVDRDDSQAYAVPAAREERPDIAAEFASPALIGAGFTVRASLAGVRPGTYAVALEDDGRIAEFPGITIGVRARLEGESSFDGFERDAPGFEAAIREINGTTVAGTAGPWPVNGRLACAGTIARNGSGPIACVWLVLESTVDGERRYARTRLAGPDAHGATAFHTEMDVHDVPKAVYRLSLAKLDDGCLRVSAPLADVRLGAVP